MKLGTLVYISKECISSWKGEYGIVVGVDPYDINRIFLGVLINRMCFEHTLISIRRLYLRVV